MTIPINPLKRKISDLEEPVPHKIPKYEPIIDWLFDTRHRSSSAPPCYDLSMSQSNIPRPQSPAPSSETITTATDNSIYPTVLEGNGLVMDRLGKHIPQKLQDFLDNHIIKQGEGKLSTAEIKEVEQVVEDAVNDSEYLVQDIFYTPMFPTKRLGIAKGGGGQNPFTKGPLPRGRFHCELSQPKPDIIFGFPFDPSSSFTLEQKDIMTHPYASPYIIPSKGNASFPFLVVETKSDAKGGTIWHAENQAAGAGAHRVNSMLWLYREAGHDPEIAQTLAFSVCLTSRYAHLYAHYYDSETRKFHMSKVEAYSSAEPKDIQDCNWHIANILDFALNTRLKEIKGLLKELYPFPERWPNKKRAKSKNSTPTASFSAGN